MVWFFLKVGGEQRKDKRGFVPFLFLNGSSMKEHSIKSMSTKDSHGNLRLYQNIGRKSLLCGIMNIWEILK